MRLLGKALTFDDVLLEDHIWPSDEEPGHERRFIKQQHDAQQRLSTVGAFDDVLLEDLVWTSEEEAALDSRFTQQQQQQIRVSWEAGRIEGKVGHVVEMQTQREFGIEIVVEVEVDEEREGEQARVRRDVLDVDSTHIQRRPSVFWRAGGGRSWRFSNWPYY